MMAPPHILATERVREREREQTSSPNLVAAKEGFIADADLHDRRPSQRHDALVITSFGLSPPLKLEKEKEASSPNLVSAKEGFIFISDLHVDACSDLYGDDALNITSVGPQILHNSYPFSKYPTLQSFPGSAQTHSEPHLRSNQPVCTSTIIRLFHCSSIIIIEEEEDGNGRFGKGEEADLHTLRTEQHGRARRRLSQEMGRIPPSPVPPPPFHPPLLRPFPLGRSPRTPPCRLRHLQDLRRGPRHGLRPGPPPFRSHVRSVGLVPCAVRGTAIREWEPGTHLYTNMVRRAEECVRESGGEIRAVLWYQGERDTLSRHDAQCYKANMEKLIRHVRDHLRSPSLPFIQVALASGDTHFIDMVREAQLGINLPNVVCVDAMGLPLNEDNLHLTTAAQVELGNMLADAYLQNFTA